MKKQTAVKAEELIQQAQGWVENTFPKGVVGRKVRVVFNTEEQGKDGRGFLKNFSAVVSWGKIGSFSLKITPDGQNVLALFVLETSLPVLAARRERILLHSCTLAGFNEKGGRLPVKTDAFTLMKWVDLTGWLEFID